MTPPLDKLTIAALLLCSLAGCGLLVTPQGKSDQRSVLPAPPMPKDGVILEVYSVRFPYGREDENSRLWAEIDEQSIARDLRRRLQQNGFRAGVVSGHIPRRLEELLRLKETVEEIGQPTLIEPDGRPKVMQHVIQTTAGRDAQIDASTVYGSLNVLTVGDGEVSGQTYQKAQCKLIVTALPQGDGSVRVTILPEVHHGDAHHQFTNSGLGKWRLSTARPSQSFEELRIDALLGPGDMVVMSCHTDRLGSLGHAFFSGRPAGPLEQKLIIVRVVRSGRDDLFADESTP